MTTATAPAPVQTLPPSNGDEVLYEVIDGQWVKMPPMSIRASRVASRLQSRLGTFCHDHKLGEAVMETLFRLPLLPRHRDRRPDLAVIAAQRLAQATAQPEDENAWEVVPNLAVEVVSPSDLAEDLLEKIEEYFQAGVQLVWVVYPRRRVIHVYESLTQIRGLTQTDDLDGGAVLPGFRLPVAALFPPEPVAT